MSFEIGRTVGDYQVVAVAGAGGMGTIYKVRSLITDRVDAMKVLLPDIEAAADHLERFSPRNQTLARLKHPNIAELYTAMRAGDQLVMVMEFRGWGDARGTSSRSVDAHPY